MVSLSVLIGPPIGLDGTMTGRAPGPGHRLRPQRSGGPKPAVILSREEWPRSGQGKIIAGEVAPVPAPGNRARERGQMADPAGNGAQDQPTAELFRGSARPRVDDQPSERCAPFCQPSPLPYPPAIRFPARATGLRLGENATPRPEHAGAGVTPAGALSAPIRWKHYGMIGARLWQRSRRAAGVAWHRGLRWRCCRHSAWRHASDGLVRQAVHIANLCLVLLQLSESEANVAIIN